MSVPSVNTSLVEDQSIELSVDMTALMKVLEDETKEIMIKAQKNNWTPEQVKNELRLVLGEGDSGFADYFSY